VRAPRPPPPQVITFLDQASERLPGIVHSFNIADFKRRNDHFGHSAGDRDIAELHRLLLELEPSALVARTHGDRWLVLAPESARRDVEAVVDRFARAEPFLAGWQVTATKDGGSTVSREVEPTVMTRAVRCLFAPVRTRAELEDAVLRICENDWSLPVNRPIALADVASMERTPWQCVSTYPTSPPSCPSCGGREVDWEDGDGSVYGGDGTCKGCGARLAIRDVSHTLHHPRLVRSRADAEAMLRFLEERRAAGDCARAILHVETTIEVDAVDEEVRTHAQVFVTKHDGKGDAYGFSGAPDTLAGSFERRVRPSRTVPDPREMELLRDEMARPVVDGPTNLVATSDARPLVKALHVDLAARVKRSPRPDALATSVSASLRIRWRIYSDLASRTERTDVEIIAAVEHRVPARSTPVRLYGETSSAADFEDSVHARGIFRQPPTAAELDVLVAQALVAKPW
jgi:Diguanylate cyclase, GGDEF domain